MKRSPEELEKLIHQTLRSVPDRRAPRTLEARVLAAIAARQPLPWWKQSFGAWPSAMRIAFLVLSSAVMASLAAAWMLYGADQLDFMRLVERPLAVIDTLRNAGAALVDFGGVVLRSIPTMWLYGGLACLAALYATVFGLGATAYRTLYANR